MDCERSNITILVVDHDEVSLAFVANILMARQYKVQTAKNAHDALVTLRANEGLFDIIITEFHVLGMDGFDFQKHIQYQFQIPVIMMSKDNRQHIISKTLENGATHFIVKPVCAEDFRDILKYVAEAKKHKLFMDNLFLISEEESSEQSNTKEEYCKRKSIDESPGEEKCQLVKKSSRIVWTTQLHNLFVDAIKTVGLKKAVPNKILEIMNIPNLTREHVSSHLQKYRLFLEKVAEKEMIGGISDEVPSSTFASNVPTSMIREVQEMRTKKLRATFYKIGNESNVRNIFNHFPSNNNEFPFIQKGLTLQDLDQVRIGKPNLETNGFASTRFSPYGSRQGLMAASSSNFSRRGFEFGETSNQNHSSIGNGYFNHINHGVKNLNFGSWNKNMAQNVTCDARNNNPFGIKNNNIFEMGGIGTMNKRGFDSVGIRDDNANSNNFGLNVGGQNANVNFGSLGYKNANSNNFGLNVGGQNANVDFGSLGYKNANNNNFGLNVGGQNANVNFGSLGYKNANSNNCGLNVGGQNANVDFGSSGYKNANSNNIGLNVGGQNANVNFGSLGYKNFGLVQGGFGSLSYVRDGSGSEFQELFKEENVSRNREIPLQISNRNIVENEQNNNGGTFTNVEFNISNFSMANDMNLLNKMNENNDASAFLKSDLINSIQDVQPLDQLYNGGGDTSLDGNTSCVLNDSPISENQNSMQLYKGGDAISSSAEINSCMLNESPISLHQNSNQLQGNEQFSNGEPYDMFMGDKASTSATNPKLDMDLFEAVFGTNIYN